LSGHTFAQPYRRGAKRIDDLLLHAVARSQMKLSPHFIVFVNDSAISSGKLDGMSDNRGEDCFKF
jgi:hypothetical protein